MSNLLRTYITYSGTDLRIIPMNLLRRRYRPNIPNVIVVEISSNGCCDPIPPVIQGGSNRLRAWVGLDKRGNVLIGPIVMKNKPKNGRWVEVPYEYCCDSFSTTTTSTSTSSSTTSTTTTLPG